MIGEGLLGESVGGRERTLAAALEAETPPFRFSRMGPSGWQATRRTEHEEDRRRNGRGSAGPVADPCGLHVPRPVRRSRPDVRQDGGHARRQRHADRPLQGRSPTLDLDSMYGGGPNDPESAKFYEADGLHLKMGKTEAFGGFPGKQGFDLLRGAGSTVAEKRKAIIPDERNDENLAVAQLHLAMIRFHNRVVDTLDPTSHRRIGSAALARRWSSTTSGCSRRTTCRASARRASSTTSSTRAERLFEVDAPRPTCRRCRSSSRSRRSGSGIR